MENRSLEMAKTPAESQGVKNNVVRTEFGHTTCIDTRETLSEQQLRWSITPGLALPVHFPAYSRVEFRSD